MKKLILFVLLLSSSQVALSKESLVFSCITKSGKQLLITEDKNYYYYSYGKNGRPEMTFKNAKSNAVIYADHRYSTLILENKGIDYEIYEPFRANEDGSYEDTDITVSKNGKTLATTKCINVLHSLYN